LECRGRVETKRRRRHCTASTDGKAPSDPSGQGVSLELDAVHGSCHPERLTAGEPALDPKFPGVTAGTHQTRGGSDRRASGTWDSDFRASSACRDPERGPTGGRLNDVGEFGSLLTSADARPGPQSGSTAGAPQQTLKPPRQPVGAGAGDFASSAAGAFLSA
jgi:hypothetical protein